MLFDILPLSNQELDRLLDALAQGAIGPESELLAIRRAGLAPQAERIHGWLPGAVRQLGSVTGVIASLQLLREERRRTGVEHPPPELILTGPDVEGVVNRDTRVAVRELLESARKNVLLVGYAFHGSDRIFEPLAARMAGSEDLTVRFVVNVHRQRRQTVEQTIREFAEEFLRSSWPFHPRPEIFYSQASLEDQGNGYASVHAKLIVVDRRWVYLGSANFTTAAFQRNLEAGIRIRNAALSEQLTNYFERLIAEGHLHPLPLD